VVLLRTAAAAACARLDYDVDRLEDVRLAVDEVAAMLVADALPDTDLECALASDDDGRLTVTLAGERDGAPLPDRDSFAWAVLGALVDDVEVRTEGARVVVVLQASRGARGRADG
jgi:serine/threonine-protein kinase RsbW